jgi:hypothetical protein
MIGISDKEKPLCVTTSQYRKQKINDMEIWGYMFYM